MLTMFAIPNCDTVKKVRSFLEKKKIEYVFTDFKKTAPTKTQIKAWADYCGELPVNKKGLTYKKHKDAYEALPNSAKIDFIIAYPSMIKRPILVRDGTTIAVGFEVEIYEGL